jgi:hypothetical protein
MYYDAANLFARLAVALENRVGAERAITLNDLARDLGVPRRMVEKTIEENIARFPFPLVADGAGYHIPTSPAELNHYAAALRGRCIRIFQRRRAVIRQAVKAGWRREGNAFVAAPAQMEFAL